MRSQVKQNAFQFENNYLILALLVSDSFFTFLAFFSAYFLRNKGVLRVFLDAVQPIEVYLLAFPFATIVLLVIYSAIGLYGFRQRKSQFVEMYAVLKATSLWILIIMSGSYLVKFDYSRIIVTVFYFFTIFFVVIGRLIVRKLQREYFHLGFGRTNILILGSGKKAIETALRIKKYKQAGLHLAGFVNETKSRKVLGKFSNLPKVIMKNDIDEVFIVESKLSNDQLLNLISRCSGLQVKFRVSSNVFSLVSESTDVANLESLPYLDLSKFKLPWWKLIPKRLFDLLLSIILLVVTFPLWILIVVLIKMDSKGKAILTQKRVGLDGKKFDMYKFRTLKIGSPLYSEAPLNYKDKRITRMGKFLRSTSLDELPQLLNIVVGDMSLVGPRPEMEFIVKKYKNWQKRRLDVKPGLTGLWQILGRKDIPLYKNLEYDFYYINNQSFFLDIVILLKTVPTVLIGKGAY